MLVIVDIDGTIAKAGARNRFITREGADWEAFYEDDFNDEPIKPMVDLVDSLYEKGFEICFCTSRSEIVRDKTEAWLIDVFGKEKIESSTLLMRKLNDRRPCEIVKPELLRENDIKPKDISFILEDRVRMCVTWRNFGILTLQVG
jgi:hypothetical protein